MTKKKQKMGGHRPGAGRPVELKGGVRKQVMLDQPTIDKIIRYATRNQKSFSSALRTLVARARLPTSKGKSR